METVASSAVCMRGRHRHRSSGVTVGCVRPWVYQPGYRISLPHFFPRPTILPPLHSLVFLLSFEASGCHDFRLAGQQRRGGNPRCHGDCPLGYTLDNMAADVPTRPTACASFPLPYPRQGSARGCFCTGGAEARIPPQWPETPMGAWRVYLVQEPSNEHECHSLVSLCRRSLYVHVCPLCLSFANVSVSYSPLRNRGDRGLNHRPSLSKQECVLRVLRVYIYMYIYLYTCTHGLDRVEVPR